MARLAPDSTWLLQQNDGIVTLFQEGTEIEVVRFDPSDANATAQAQKVIHDSDKLSAEEKCFAHFWSGYFHAHNSKRGEHVQTGQISNGV